MLNGYTGALLALLLAVSAPEPAWASYLSGKGGPPTPGANATDFQRAYVTAPDSRGSLEKTAPEPPATPMPGDRRRNTWTECEQAAGPCTRTFVEDRYQREDAPIDGNDANVGNGPYRWVPVNWGSSSCARYNACLLVDFGDLIGV